MDRDTPSNPAPTPLPASDLEARVATLGRKLSVQISRVVEALPGEPQGPVLVAKVVGVDKVLTSRLLRAAASRDPVAAVQLLPGPDPLRNFANCAGKKGVPTPLVNDFVESVNDFEEMIRTEAGSRSGFDAILASWLPEARGEFELRRKQSIFRAMSELKGKSALLNLATAMLHPSADGEHLDIVWVFAYVGLRRLRPGVVLKFATRRVETPHGDGIQRAPRRPRTLDGEEVEGLDGLLLEELCSTPKPEVHVHRAGDRVHYTIGNPALFGPRSSIDLAFAEVNLRELPRYMPIEPRRKRFVYTDVSTPVELMVFDALIHEDILGGTDPSLLLYDTTGRGIADINDRSRDVDRLDLMETLSPLGRGVDSCRVGELPGYVKLLKQVCAKLGWEERTMRAFRSRIDYPLYGSQVALAYEAQAKPSS